MLPIYISIIILAVAVIILSIVCLRLNKRINTPVKYVDEQGFEIRIPYLAKAISALQFGQRELNRRIKSLEEGHYDEDIDSIKANYTNLVNYLTAKQGVNCVDCIHADVCDSSKTMCKGNNFGMAVRNGTNIVFRPNGLCSKFIAKKDGVDLSNLRNTTEEKPEC